MNVLLIEPYFTGSHRAWCEEYRRHSRHDISLLTLEGRYWKWRMHGGAVTLAGRYAESRAKPDVILVGDMLNLPVFLSLTRSQTAGIPVAMYFHENQLTYPWSPGDRDVQHRRDAHYAFINYSSCLAAGRVFFNSQWHRDSFLGELPAFLKGFPDHNGLDQVEAIREKSAVLPCGLDLASFDAHQPPTPNLQPPTRNLKPPTRNPAHPLESPLGVRQES